MQDSVKNYIAIAGPTASGKSALAMQIAEAFDGEIINCDSVQLYRGFDIGSAKPSLEERRRVPHHLIDTLDPHSEYDARIFAEQCQDLIDQIRQRGRLPIVVGGTGLYFRALWRQEWHDLPKDEDLRRQLADWSSESLRLKLSELDPERAAKLHINDRFRLQRALEIALLTGQTMAQRPMTSHEQHRAFTIRILCPRPLLEERSRQRVQQMLDDGLVDELKTLLAAGVDPLCKPMQSIGYAQTLAFLQGKIPESDLLERIAIATRQYAKRQETWFKKMTFDACWQTATPTAELLQSLELFWTALSNP